MKKFISIIALFIISVSAFGQKTVKELHNGFKNGCFYLEGKEFSTLFQAVEIKQGEDGNIKQAVFETVANNENTKKGEEWFKDRMKSEDERMLMSIAFYKMSYIVIGNDYTVTKDGRVRVTITMMKEV